MLNICFLRNICVNRMSYSFKIYHARLFKILLKQNVLWYVINNNFYREIIIVIYKIQFIVRTHYYNIIYGILYLQGNQNISVLQKNNQD